MRNDVDDKPSFGGKFAESVDGTEGHFSHGDDGDERKSSLRIKLHKVISNTRLITM